MRPPRRMAGPWTAAAGTSGIPDSGGVAHGPGRRPLVRGGVMHAPPRRRGADGLRGEVNPLQAVCGGARRQAGTNGCRVRAMRRIPPSCGQARSCRVFPRRNGGTRTRGLAAPSRARCQLRHIPKPSPSSPGAEAPMGQKGGWRRRTPAGTRTRIDGFGDRRACHCTTDARGGVHDAARLAARSSGRQARGRLPRAPSRIRTRDLPVANGMRCLCATAPCRSPPMRGPAGKGVIRVAALRRWCPRPDSNRRRPP